MIHTGYRVVRVSLRSDSDGDEIGERGTVEIVFQTHGQPEPYGYTVKWDKTAKREARAQWVLPQRIVTVEEWAAGQRHQPASM